MRRPPCPLLSSPGRLAIRVEANPPSRACSIRWTCSSERSPSSGIERGAGVVMGPGPAGRPRRAATGPARRPIPPHRTVHRSPRRRSRPSAWRGRGRPAPRPRDGPSARHRPRAERRPAPGVVRVGARGLGIAGGPGAIRPAPAAGGPLAGSGLSNGCVHSGQPGPGPAGWPGGSAGQSGAGGAGRWGTGDACRRRARAARHPDPHAGRTGPVCPRLVGSGRFGRPQSDRGRGSAGRPAWDAPQGTDGRAPTDQGRRRLVPSRPSGSRPAPAPDPVPGPGPGPGSGGHRVGPLTPGAPVAQSGPAPAGATEGAGSGSSTVEGAGRSPAGAPPG